MSVGYLQRAAALFEPPVQHCAKALMIAAGMTPDPWQANLMAAHPDRALLLCSRQAGKSMTVAAIALEQSLTNPASTTLLVSASQRQPRSCSTRSGHWRWPRPPGWTGTTLRPVHAPGQRSRIVSLPVGRRSSGDTPPICWYWMRRPGFPTASTRGSDRCSPYRAVG